MTKIFNRATFNRALGIAAPMFMALAMAAMPLSQAEAAMRALITKPLIEAQKLANTEPKDFAGAMAKVQEADLVPEKTPEEEYNVAKMVGFIAINQQDMKTAQAAYNRAMASNGIPEKEQAQVYNTALLLNFQNQDYAGAIKAGSQLRAIKAPVDDKSYVVIGQAYYFTNDFANAALVADEGIKSVTAAGGKPSDELYVTLMNAQKGKGDTAAARATQEALTLASPTAENWQRLLDLEIGRKGITNHQILNLYRLRLMAGAMAADDYGVMASLDLSEGLPGEAKSVLEKGLAAGTITRGGNVAQSLQRAQQQAPADEKSLPGLAKIAASSKTGEIEIKLGESYWTYGNSAEAEAAIKRGIAKGGLKDPSDAQITLGIVLLSQGKKDEAKAAFDAAAGSPAGAGSAGAWNTFLKHKG